MRYLRVLLILALLPLSNGPVSAAYSAQPTMMCSHGRAPGKPQSGAAPLNAISYLTAAGDLQRNFSLSANLVLPKMPSNRGLFYTDWIILGQQGDEVLPFVQVNLLRWKRYDYRPEISYTWMGPNKKLVYQDSTVFLNDKPHNFEIGAQADRMFVRVDNIEVCHGSMYRFFGNNPKLSYQLGGELVHYGDRIEGAATNIRFKSDKDPYPKIHNFRCEWIDRGLHWKKTGIASFRLEGVETKTAKTGVEALIPGGCGPS